jgi:hypothetical protein
VYREYPCNHTFTHTVPQSPPRNSFNQLMHEHGHNSIFAYYFLKVHLHNFSKIKKSKRSHRKEESRFFSLFLLDDEGFGSGSVPLTNGSRSRRPENICIRIRNTGFHIQNLPQAEPFRISTNKRMQVISTAHRSTLLYVPCLECWLDPPPWSGGGT